MQIDTDALDALIFAKLVNDAKTASRERASNLLAEALRMWRGSAYEDVREHSPIADQACRLDEEYLQAETRYAELQLELGEHAELLPRLTKLVEVHPFHEDFRAHLMLALYRCGRQSEALKLFRDTRKLLSEELGIEPGPALRQIHGAMLRSETSLDIARGSTATVPRGLPADIAGFVGRREHLQALNEMLYKKSPIVISAIAGTAGVGKTALAVHWAHQVANHFPDGQLHVNLRGFDPAAPPLNVGQAVRRFLDALGVAAQRVPAELEAQVALYRSLLADRRMLVILDNAHDAEQVRPLLPGSPTCLVIITSRVRLASLVATNNARPVMLDVLSDAEAESMLIARLGADRVVASPGATQRIIERCARLPLALAIACARATTEPSLSLAELATQLEDVHAFSSDDDPMTDLRAVFSWSYQQLSPAAARLFRLLGLHPGPDISAAATASLAGQPVQHELAELTHAHMLSEHVGGRYTFHDLLRSYARKQADAWETSAGRDSALRRMFDHYLHTAVAAEMIMYPTRTPIELPAADAGCAPESVINLDQALAWFDTEKQVLIGVTKLAERSNSDLDVSNLCAALVTYLDRRGDWATLAEIQLAAVRAARVLSDPRREANSHRVLARAYSCLGNSENALEHLASALSLFEEIGDHRGQGNVHMGRAQIFEWQGQFTDALHESERALASFKASGREAAYARALNAIGWRHAQLDEYQEALDLCERALTMQHELGDIHGRASTLDSLGYIHHQLGNHNAAVDSCRQALLLFRQIGNRSLEATALTHIGDFHAAAGELDLAQESWNAALRILESLDRPDADGVRAKLRQLVQG